VAAIFLKIGALRRAGGTITGRRRGGGGGGGKIPPLCWFLDAFRDQTQVPHAFSRADAVANLGGVVGNDVLSPW